MDEILDSCADRATRFAKESKPLHRVLPFKRKATPVGDRPDFCLARYVNTDFSRISRQKTILRSRTSSMTLSDLENLDRASRSLIASQSQSFWLLSSLLAQLRDVDFKPADPNLFDQTITTLSASLASQINLSSGMSEFVTSKRRESYLVHTSCPAGESVKRELLVAPGTDNLLFNQPLLEKVVSTIKEDSLISSTASLASISKAASRGRSGASGSGGYASPLDFSRPSTSGYRKRSASPARGSSKRARRGRGRTPSSNRGKGFRRWESCPNPIAIDGCLSLHWQVWSDEGTEPWVVEVLRWGYQIPFRWAPTLSRDPIPLPAYAPSSIRGKALEGEVQALLNKGAIELAPLPSPDFYSRLFVVMELQGHEDWSSTFPL